MSDRPNIVYILADDMGYGDCSCLNPRSQIRTPHLDALAAGGLIARDAHASSAVCTPSRYSLMTGRYSWRSRLKEGVTDGYAGPVIEPGRLTVAALLKAHGYRTACIGKWHLGWTWPGIEGGPAAVDFTRPIPDGPTTRGFDTYFGISASLDMPPYVYIDGDRPTAVPDHLCPAGDGKLLQRAGPTAPDFEHQAVLPTLAERALAFVDDCATSGEPFFLYLPLSAPHTPILPTPEFQGRSGTNEYGDFCLQVDSIVGRLTAALERHGLTDDTIVIFTADNGCSPRVDFAELAALGHHPSHVFRGHKADIYEGGHRIPFIVRWPRVIAAGTATDETIGLFDLLATCAEILGVSLPPDAGEDSVSNLGVWRGQPFDRSQRAATIHHSLDGSFAIRCDHWKLEMCPASGGWSGPHWHDADHQGLPPIQLYDLRADIGERRNCQAEQPAVVAELTVLLTDYIARGRSTPGAAQPNAADVPWPHLWWLAADRA